MTKKDLNTYHQALQSIGDFYNAKIYKLVKFIYSEGHTQKKVSEILGIDQGAVSRDYPKEERS